MTKGRVVGTDDSRGRPRVQTSDFGPSRTVQSDAHLADITQIMSNFADVGLDALDAADLIYADVSEFTDLRDALDQAALAEVEFLKLPSKVREVFEHDVAVWLDTAHDEDKRAELVARGLLKGPEPPENDPPTVEPKGPKVDSKAGEVETAGDPGKEPA